MEQTEQTPTLVKVNRLDSVPVNEAYFTKEGYLIDHPILTSVGIFEYKNPDGSKRRELRLPEYVFDQKSLESYKGKPIIITHKAESIDKNNVKDENIGTILSEGYQDGDNVRAEIIIHDTNDMERSELRELSLGYNLDLIEEPGVWNGQPYDVIQTNIRINHLALVRKARAGDNARLNIDEKENQNNLLKGEKEKMAESTENKDLGNINGEENEDNGVDNIGESGGVEQTLEEKLGFIRERKDRRDRSDGDKSESEAEADIDTLLEIVETLQAKNDVNELKKDSDGEKKENEDCDNGGTSINADSVDEIVQERINLGRLGDKLNLDVYGMKPKEAKKAIIKNRFPNMRLDGKSDGYINAVFKDVASEVNERKDVNYQRRQMSQNRKDAADFARNKTSAETAREKMQEKILNGGK